jgi:signal transduction histidine kinase
MIEKVFYNLIDNSVRHGLRAKRLRFSAREGPEGLTVVCEDDGVGIPLSDKERIFEQGVGKNTGYGLYLAREILAITGLSITENGTEGNGARFEIRIPLEAYHTVR